MLETVIGSSLSLALRNSVLGVGALALLALTSLKLTLLVLGGLPVVLLPIIFFGRRLRRLARASQDRVADTGAYVDEAIHEIRTVQAYAHEAEDRQRLCAAGGGGVRHRRAPHPAEGALARRGDLPGVRRGGHHPVGRRARRAARQAHRGPAFGLRFLCRDRRHLDRRGERSGRRSAARAGGDRAAARAPRHAGGDRRADAGAAAARSAAGDLRARGRDLRLPVASGGAGAQGGVAAGDHRRARGAGGALGRGQDHRVPAAASLLRSPVRAGRRSTASMPGAPIRARCGSASPWCRRIR